MHRNRLAAGLCAVPHLLAGFKGWVPGKGKEGSESKEGGGWEDEHPPHPISETRLRSLV